MRAVALFSGALAVVILAACASLDWGSSDTAQVDDTQSVIAHCQSVGLSCKADGGAPQDCYDQYSACMHAGGL